MNRRILLIGATGAFGSRLAAMLARIPGADLVVTSRCHRKAQALARTLAQQGWNEAYVTGVNFIQDSSSAAQLARLEPWLVIDAAGPFQRATYETAKAAIAAGAHWLDLADAARYIDGFVPALDTRARERGVVAVTGASSTPALSFATVQALTEGWLSIDTIEIGIYPAGRSAVGQAVLEAVLSYAGAPVAVWRDGRAASTTGWGRAERLKLTGIPHRYRSPVATYDSVLLSRAFAARNVSFYAGLESPLEHLGLTLLARLRARGGLPRLEGLAPWLQKARRLTAPFCGETGAMAVSARGTDSQARPINAEWKLLAENGDGPNVPVLPALAFTRKLLAAGLPSGAFCAGGLLTLAEIEREFASFAIASSRSSLQAASSIKQPGLSCVMAA